MRNYWRILLCKTRFSAKKTSFKFCVCSALHSCPSCRAWLRWSIWNARRFKQNTDDTFRLKKSADPVFVYIFRSCVCSRLLQFSNHNEKRKRFLEKHFKRKRRCRASFRNKRKTDFLYNHNLRFASFNMFFFDNRVSFLLFGPANFSTLEVELYLRSQNLSEPQKAAIIAITETLIALIFVTLFALIERRSEKNKSSSESEIAPKRISKASVKEKIVFTLFIIIVFIGFVLPFLMIFHNAFLSKVSQKGSLSGKSFSVENFIWLFRRKNFFSSLKNTFSVGLQTSFFSCLIGFALSLFFFKNKNRFVSKIFSFIPMSISTVATGFVFLVIFRRGSVSLLIFAEVFLYWPYAFRTILNSMEKIPYEIQEASMIFCRSYILRIFTVYLPLSKNAIFSSFFFCFALSAGDASLPLVLGIPRFSNIALDTYRLASAYRFNEACASGVLLFILTTILYAASTLFEKRKQ